MAHVQQQQVITLWLVALSKADDGEGGLLGGGVLADRRPPFGHSSQARWHSQSDWERPLCCC